MAAYPKAVHSDNTRFNQEYSNQGINGMSDKDTNGNGTAYENANEITRLRTAGSVNISPELFEKLYLSPETRVKGDLRKTFANPTPM